MGPSRRLTLNYRTTAELLCWALGILEGGEFADVDGEPGTREYRSARRGPEPLVVERTAGSKLDGVARAIRTWFEAGTSLKSILVLVRSQYERNRVVAGLQERGVRARAVDREKPTVGQRLAMTRHRATGTEFLKVVMTGVGGATTSLDGRDPAEREDVEWRERLLLYVAATPGAGRTRDAEARPKMTATDSCSGPIRVL